MTEADGRLGDEGDPQVAVEDVAEPHEVLQVDRFTQPELLIEDGLGLRRGAETEDDGGRISGQEVDQVEAPHRYDEDDADQQHQSFRQISEHFPPW